MRSKTDHFDSETRAPAAAANARELPKPRVQTAFSTIVQRASADPRALTRTEVAQLQRTIGNAAVARMLTKAAPRANETGLPDGLKAGVEALSGVAMDDVRVHYNSARPADVQALAYAQGADIHVGPGQEKHLPHEAWHVVQQKQGRVRPTLQLQGVAINDEDTLEREAGLMGRRAAGSQSTTQEAERKSMVENPVIQRAIGYEAEIGFIRVRSADENKLTLSKGLRLWTGPGYQVTVDEQDGGRFDLEFITDPIDDLAPGGRDKVRATLSAVASEWENIEKEKGEFPATHFHAGPVPGAGITISYMTNIAQIQATAGLSLDAMHRIASGAAKHEWDEESANKNKGTDKGDKEEEGVGDYLGTAGQTDAWLWKPVEEATPALLRALGLKTDHWAKNYLTAIIALLVTPPIASWQTDAKAPYPKAFAGPLLARTDFATIIALLPNDLRVAIQSNREAWIRHLVGLVESVLAKVNDDSPPTIGDVGRSVFNPKSFSGKPPNFGDRLKLVDWYGDLTTGTDRLTADDYRERYADETGAAHLESLGSFGKKMDASSYRIGRLALLQAVVGAGVAVAGAIGATVEPDAKAGWTALAIGSAMALHGSSKTIAAVRDRPIFEFRTLSNMVVRETLVAAGLELWDFVDLAHGRPQARMSGGEKLWNWVGSKLSRN